MDKSSLCEPVGRIALDLGGFQAGVLHGIDQMTEEFMRVFLTAHPKVFIQRFEVADDGLGGNRITGALPTRMLLLLLLLVVMVVMMLAMTALSSSAALARMHVHDQVTHKIQPPPSYSSSPRTRETLHRRGRRRRRRPPSFHEILRQRGEVREALQRRVEEAGITQIIQPGTCPPYARPGRQRTDF